MLRYNLRYQVFLVVSDVLLVMGALWLSSKLRITIDLGADAVREAFITPPVLFIIAAALWLFAFQQAGVYGSKGDTRFGLTVRRVLAGHLLACLLFLGALYITYRDYSRLQAVYFMLLSLAAVLTHRVVLRLLRRALSRFINTQRPVVIVGHSRSARHLGKLVRDCEEAGLRLVGFVSPTDAEPVESALAAPLLGTLEDLPEIVGEHGVVEVIVAVQWFDQQASDMMTRIMLLLERFPVNIRLAPDYSELAYFRATTEDFRGVMLIGLREAVLSPVQRVFKRGFDIAFSLLVLALAWPLMLAVAVAIRLDSEGPAIFQQQRIGQHGRRFTIYKFRTMYVDADRILDRAQVYRFVKRPDDPRVTRVGRWLRRTSLDELPQFFNVLRGDMSVVGPRPEVTWLADQYEWWQRKRFEVPQGITGWWQVNGRADKPMRLNTEDDLFYVRNYSIWLDFQIIFRTIISWITGRGAY